MQSKKSFFIHPVCLILASGLAILPSCSGNNKEPNINTTRVSEAALGSFEENLKRLQGKYRIPGMSVAVLHKQKLLVAKGYGFSDLTNQIPASKNTPYNLASCTKPIAAIVLMQLVDRGKLDLDTPMTILLKEYVCPVRYRGRELKGYDTFIQCLKDIIKDKNNPLAEEFRNSYGNYHPEKHIITPRHHLTHTSEGIPGDSYHYNGDLYSFLALVVEAIAGKSFPQVMADQITTPLKMASTLPASQAEARNNILKNRSKYYRTGPDGGYQEVMENRPVKWPDILMKIGLEIEPSFLINAGAGMVSTVEDLARLDIALNQDRLLSTKTREMMFTAYVSNNGKTLPYGLGWFVQKINGKKLVWHFGYGGIHSSLYLKVPEEDKTFILLANSGGASSKFNLGITGDVRNSPFAVAFLTHLTDIKIQ